MPTGTVVSRGYLAAVDGVRGRVHAMFDRSAYVAVDEGPALVLHPGDLGHTPTSLCPAIWPAPLAVGDRVVGRAGRLKVGELVLDIRSARVWRPSPVSTARVGDVGLGAAHRDALRAAGRRAGGLVPALERALAARDGDRVAGCVASLVGHGPGLTPSGDDVLVGLLAVGHRVGPDRTLPELLRPAVLGQLHRTGDISAHYLRLAVDGHFGEPLVALCDGLAAGSRDAVHAAANAVLATGATSGADALLGVATGMRAIAATRATAVAA